MQTFPFLSWLRALVPMLLLLSATPGAADDSLLAAQRRMSVTLKELNRANAEVKRREGRVREAEEALVRSQRKAEDDKAKLEQARKGLNEAKSGAEVAQRDYDQASTEIQRLYRERQPPSSSKP